MLSVQDFNTEDQSAKNKARREKWWIFPVVLIFCVLIIVLSAAGIHFLFSPVEYSEAEVDAYVKSIYGDSWSLQKKSALSDVRGEGTRYLYAGGEGGSFSVFSLSVPIYENGEPTGRYNKALFDNYFSTVIEKNLESLEKLGEKKKKKDSDCRLEIEKDGDSSGIYGAEYAFRIYIENRTGLNEAAELVEKMDSLLAFSRAGEDASIDSPFEELRRAVPSVRIYLKPEKSGPAADAISSADTPYLKGTIPKDRGLTTDWRSAGEREKYRISTIPFTDDQNSRMKTSDIASRLENDYVDAAKTSGRTFYAAPQELKAKYPAPVLTLVNAGGHVLSEVSRGKGQFTYTFIYHRATGMYWLTGLDPCEDFDGNPFGNYSRRGAFAKLVEYLGGSFSCDNWTGSWRIGDNRWSATAVTKKTGTSPYTYSGFQLFRNGNNEKLDEIPDLFLGTGALPSGRPFSIKDLIRMLDVRITINQQDMTAVMFRDIANER